MLKQPYISSFPRRAKKKYEQIYSINSSLIIQTSLSQLAYYFSKSGCTTATTGTTKRWSGLNRCGINSISRLESEAKTEHHTIIGVPIKINPNGTIQSCRFDG